MSSALVAVADDGYCLVQNEEGSALSSRSIFMTHKLSLLRRAIKSEKDVLGVGAAEVRPHIAAGDCERCHPDCGILVTLAKKLLIGMLHLPALPGAPNHHRELAEVESRLVEEACLLSEVGFHGAMMENLGDVPFHKGASDVTTIASMKRLAMSVQRAVPELSLGINVLRNDARGALAIAFATGARFIRVNVHVGATATDQGIIEGQAAATLRLKKELGSDVAIWADVHVKHGKSLAHASITSGVTAENLTSLLDLADGVIVGTSLKADGRTTNPIDRGRAERFIERAR